MEPVTAISLTTNIFQLIEIGTRIASMARDLRKSASGLTREAEQFRNRADLVRSDVDAALQSITEKEDTNFHASGVALRECIDKYLTELETIKVRKPGNIIQSVKAAINTWRKQEELENLLRTIEDTGTTITMHIVTVYLPRMDTKLDVLQKQNKGLESQLTQQMTELMAQIKGSGVNNNHCDLLKAVQKWFRDREELEVRRRCLQALYFQELSHREDVIKDAHRKTFSWIFSTTSEHNNCTLASAFRQWLHSYEHDHNQNVFWISGKPGAGKSTLMKFIAHHDLLLSSLQHWAGSQTLIMLNYYFWRSGSHIQRSLKGLLRSILHQALLRLPELVGIVFDNTEWMSGSPDFEFSVTVLRKALKKLLVHATQFGFRLFILIDGLDEFDDRDELDDSVADETDLVEFLRLFYGSPSFKLCVSSRPLNVFMKEFGQDAKRYLQVHELTQEDIRVYVQETLQNDFAFQELVRREDGYMYDDLVGEIIEAAKGVFLWVRLTSRSLLLGIINSDRISDLRRKLRCLPSALKELYKHILDSIEPEYAHRAARIFMCLSELAVFPTAIDRWGIPLGVGDAMTPLVVAFAYLDPSEHSSVMEDGCNSLRQLADLQIKLRKPIEAYSRGLLDIYSPKANSAPEYNHSLALKSIFFQRITYTHRTVGEFFQTAEIHENLCNKTGMTYSDLRFSICRGHLALIQAASEAMRKLHSSSFVIPHLGDRAHIAVSEWEESTADSFSKSDNNSVGTDDHYAPLGCENYDDIQGWYYFWGDSLSYMGAQIQCFSFQAAKIENPDVHCYLWTELEKLLCVEFDNVGNNLLNMLLRERRPRLKEGKSWNILGCAIYFGAPDTYLEKRLALEPELLHPENGGLSPLVVIVAELYNPEIIRRRKWLETLELILKYGADPNEEFQGSTPWAYFLSSFFCRWLGCVTNSESPIWSEFSEVLCAVLAVALPVFLAHEADLDATCHMAAVFCHEVTAKEGLEEWSFLEARPSGALSRLYRIQSNFLNESSVELTLTARNIILYMCGSGLKLDTSLLQTSEHLDALESSDGLNGIQEILEKVNRDFIAHRKGASLRRPGVPEISC
jgi:hypothetical protein